MSPAAWGFFGLMVTQGVVLVGILRQQRRTGHEVSQVNRAVNDQPVGVATLVERVGVIGDDVEQIKGETVAHREWERKVFIALAKEVGVELPRHPSDPDGTGRIA